MTQHRFHHAVLIALVALSAGALASDALAAGSKSHTASKSKAKAEPAKPAGQPIEYAALETRVGETVSVETTFNTTRTGTLIKWTQPTLTLQLGTEQNPMVLTVPKETIKTLMIMTSPPAAEPAKDAGTSGAKKN